MLIVIDFEDFGQPFTQWKATETGEIKECTPKHADFWVGRTIDNISSLMEGRRVEIRRYSGTPITIKYPISKIQYQ